MVSFAYLKDTITKAAYQTASAGSEEAAATTTTTPGDSPREGEDAAPESRQDDGPSSPKAKNSGRTRPLRLGTYDFDNPDHDRASSSSSSLPFPPLFHEADDMLNLSNLVYTLVDLRNLARKGGMLESEDASRLILETPLNLGTALRIMTAEGETLKAAFSGDGEHAATLSALESLTKRQRELASTMQQQQQQQQRASEDEKEAASKKSGLKKDDSVYDWISHCWWATSSKDEENDNGVEVEVAKKQLCAEIESSVITAVGDSKSEEELVYAVGVNPVQQRITVTFRGSVTKADFVTDAKISIIRAPDPLKGSADAGDRVGIHQGFYEYLFGEPGGRPSKYAEIMDHIDELLEQNPARKGYRLYVTGHSLGGALSTLFGFYAAASPPDVPSPITVVSVASPRVGNVDFARVFVEMESRGLLRHLRVANHQDPVTLGPTVSSRRALALSAKVFSPLGYLALTMTGNGEGGEEEVYYHTGMKAKLFKKGRRCTLAYSGARLISGSKDPDAIDKDDVADTEQSNKWKRRESSAELPMVSYHFGATYSERLALAEPDLKGLTLNHLYQEKFSACSQLTLVG